MRCHCPESLQQQVAEAAYMAHYDAYNTYHAVAMLLAQAYL